MEEFQHGGVMESSMKLVSISLDASINTHALHNVSFSNSLVQKLIIASANPTLGEKRYHITIDSEYRIIQTRVIAVTNNAPPQSTITVKLLHSTTNETVEGNLEVYAELLPNVPSASSVYLRNQYTGQEVNEPMSPQTDDPMSPQTDGPMSPQTDVPLSPQMDVPMSPPMMAELPLDETSLSGRLTPITPPLVPERLYQPDEVEEVYDEEGDQVQSDHSANTSIASNSSWTSIVEPDAEDQRVNEEVATVEQAPHNSIMYHSVLKQLLNRPILGASDLLETDLDYNFQHGSNVFIAVPMPEAQNVTHTAGLQIIQRQSLNYQPATVGNQSNNPGLQSIRQPSILLQPQALGQLIRTSGFEQIVTGANPAIAEQYLEAQDNIRATEEQIAPSQLVSISAIVSNDQNHYISAYLQMLRRQPQDYLSPQQSQLLEQLFFGSNISVNRTRSDHVLADETINRIVDVYRQIQARNQNTQQNEPDENVNSPGLVDNILNAYHTVGSQIQRQLPAFNSIFSRTHQSINEPQANNLLGSQSQTLHQYEHYSYHQFSVGANRMSTPVQSEDEEDSPTNLSDQEQQPEIFEQNIEQPNSIPPVLTPETMNQNEAEQITQLDIIIQLQQLQERNHKLLLQSYNTCMTTVRTGSFAQTQNNFMYTNYRLIYDEQDLIGELDMDGFDTAVSNAIEQATFARITVSQVSTDSNSSSSNTDEHDQNLPTIFDQPFVFRELKFHDMFFFRPSNFALNYIETNQEMYHQLMISPENNIFCSFLLNSEFLDADLSEYSYRQQAQIHANNFFSNNMHLLMLDSKIFIYKCELIYATFMTYLHDVSYFGDRSEGALNDEILPNPFYDPTDPISMPTVSIHQLNVMNTLPFLATMPIYKPAEEVTSATDAASDANDDESNNETLEASIRNILSQETTSDCEKPESNIYSDTGQKYSVKTKDTNTAQENMPSTSSAYEQTNNALSTALELCDVNLDSIYTSVKLLLQSDTARSNVEQSLKQSINSYLVAAYNEGKKDAHLAYAKTEAVPEAPNPPENITSSGTASNSPPPIHTTVAPATITRSVDTLSTESETSDQSISSRPATPVIQEQESLRQSFSAMVSQRTPKHTVVSFSSNKRIKSEDRSSTETSTSKKIKLIDLTGDDDVKVEDFNPIPTSIPVIPKQKPICISTKGNKATSKNAYKSPEISQSSSSYAHTEEKSKRNFKVEEMRSPTSKIPIIYLDGAEESPESQTSYSPKSPKLEATVETTPSNSDVQKNVQATSSSSRIKTKTKQEKEDSANSSQNRSINVSDSPDRSSHGRKQTTPIKNRGLARIDNDSTERRPTSSMDTETMPIHIDCERMSRHETKCNECCKRAGIKVPLKKTNSDSQVKFQLPKSHQSRADSPEIINLTTDTSPNDRRPRASSSATQTEELDESEIKVERPSPPNTPYLSLLPDEQNNPSWSRSATNPTEYYQPIQPARNNWSDNDNFQRMSAHPNNEDRRPTRSVPRQNFDLPSTSFSNTNIEDNYNRPISRSVSQLRNSNQENYRNYYQDFSNLGESSHQVHQPISDFLDDLFPNNLPSTSRYNDQPNLENSSRLLYQPRNAMDGYDAYYPGYTNYRRYQELLNYEESILPRNVSFDYEAPQPNQFFVDETPHTEQRPRPRSCVPSHASSHVDYSNYRQQYPEVPNARERPLSAHELSTFGRDYGQTARNSRFENNDLLYYHPPPLSDDPIENLISPPRYEVMPRSRSPTMILQDYTRPLGPRNQPRDEEQPPNTLEELYRRRSQRHQAAREDYLRRRAARRRRQYP